MLWRADTWARIEAIRKHPRRHLIITTLGPIPIIAIPVAATAVAAPTAAAWWAVAGFLLFIDCLMLFTFAMATRQRQQPARTGDPPAEELALSEQSRLGRITAHKVPKTVSPQVLRILAIDHALFLLSTFYLLEWYWLHRPLPDWVLFAAAIAFVLSIVLAVALRAVRSTRRQLASFRRKALAVWARGGSTERRHVFLIIVLGPVAGYMVWFLLPQVAGHDDIAILALVTIEAVLFTAYANFVAGRRRLRNVAGP